MAQRQPDEEIVVADGASTDGTTEYLRDLLSAGKIDQLISEPDCGESHGFNKCMLAARGELLKVITDDDFFFYPAIQACKRFMLEHPEVDLLASNGEKKAFARDALTGLFLYDADYHRWCERGTPFAFCGLGLLLRRRSLPLTGLFDTSYIKVDAEFALRVTSGKAALAWSVGPTFVHIANPRGNTITKHGRIYKETVKLDQLYFGKRPSFASRLRRFGSDIVRRWRPIKPVPEVAFDSRYFAAIFDACEARLEHVYRERPPEFLVPPSHGV